VVALNAGDVKLPPPRPWRAPDVKLLSAGAEPRALLRYALTPDAGGHAELTSAGEWKVQGEPMPLPEQSLPFDVKVDKPGQWSFRLAEGVSGTVTVDDRGLAQAVAVYPPATDLQHQADATKISVGSYYAMETVRTAFMHVLTPLPAEAVGPGAVWQVERPTTRGAVTYTEVATFTLVSRSADGGTKLSVRLGGKPDPSVKVEGLQLDVSGEGELELQRTCPVPLRLEEKLRLRARAGGTEHEGTVATHLRFDRK
jgi:hypothetical protein